jgi:hypothetical protein
MAYAPHGALPATIEDHLPEHAPGYLPSGLQQRPAPTRQTSLAPEEIAINVAWGAVGKRYGNIGGTSVLRETRHN